MGKMVIVKRFLLAASAALVLAAPAAAAHKPATTTAKTATSKTVTSKTATTKTATTSNANAPATVACRNKIINEWEGTGKIRTTYPLACYHLALTYVSGHADLTEYSSLGDDIKLALQAALQRSHGKTVPAKVGKHYGKGGGDATVGFTTTISKSGADGDVSTNASTQVADAASGAPLPILILGGVALALIAAGAVGTGVRYTRRRRNG